MGKDGLVTNNAAANQLSLSNPSVAEKQEIAAATERQGKRAPRVALNVTQSKTETTLSPTHSDVAGWQTRLNARAESGVCRDAPYDRCGQDEQHRVDHNPVRNHVASSFDL
jgi:hypothetical protein